MEFNDRRQTVSSYILDAYGKRGGYRRSMIHTAPETNDAMETFVKDPKHSRVVASGEGLPKSTPPKKRKYK